MTNPLNHPHQNQNSFQFKSADETRDKIMIYTKREEKGQEIVPNFKFVQIKNGYFFNSNKIIFQ